MKRLVALIAFALMSVSVSSSAKKFYADVQVTNINPTSKFMWGRENTNTPKYPIELARSGIRGCAILSFDISHSGKTENIEIINSLPNKSIGKYSRRMLKKWKWLPVSSEVNFTVEKRTLRLDFCMGGESTEQSKKDCIQQTKLACS